MLEAVGIRKRYGHRQVLASANVTVNRGEVVALVGPNGCGKSTLLQILALLDRTDQGRIFVAGTEVTSSNERQFRGRVTLIEQFPLMFGGNVRRNIEYAARSAPAAPGSRVEHVAELTGTAPLLDRDARSLSGGELQLAAFARAIALSPEVLLLDEPTASADAGTTYRLFSTVRQLCSEGLAVLFSTHQLSDAYRWSDRIMGLNGGATDSVTPENVFHVSAADLTAEGEMTAYKAGPIVVHAVGATVEHPTILIPPEDVLISKSQLQSSARNQYRGNIVAISVAANNALSITVDVGVPIVARLTSAAVRELGLAVGSEVSLLFKATAVRVF